MRFSQRGHCADIMHALHFREGYYYAEVGGQSVEAGVACLHLAADGSNADGRSVAAELPPAANPGFPAELLKSFRRLELPCQHLLALQ